MDWLGAEANGPLVATRAIHFAASAVTSGALIFGTMIAEPALHSAQVAPNPFRRQIALIAWTGLAIAALSGLIWFQLQAVSMSGLPFSESMTWNVLSTVLNETQFGLASEVRFALAMILAICLAYHRSAFSRWLAAGAALAFVAAIAWTGHAGATPGGIGNLHLAADTLHLCAASAWIGGLVPLVLLLSACRRNQALGWTLLARAAAQRFSTLGILSVATLLVTGLVNAWILVGSFRALLVSEYGRLLMLKIFVFVLMLLLAVVNRFWLTPALAFSSGDKSGLEALRRLTRNSVIEIAFGITIFAIVGVLGTLHPAIHMAQQ